MSAVLETYYSLYLGGIVNLVSFSTSIHCTVLSEVVGLKYSEHPGVYTD